MSQNLNTHPFDSYPAQHPLVGTILTVARAALFIAGVAAFATWQAQAQNVGVAETDAEGGSRSSATSIP